MVKITKEDFVNAITAIRKQTEKDKENAVSIARMFPGSDVFTYDNNLLEKTVIKLLQTNFPKTNDFCEIEHYCYAMNFGRIGGKDLISPEDLWDRLLVLHNDPIADFFLSE